MPLETFPDRDLFLELLMGFGRIGVRVVAYASADSPAVLQSSEYSAYDFNFKSPYVNSCELCPAVTGTPAPFCQCAPSVHNWKNYVKSVYGDSEVETLKVAYAEVIIREYAMRYNTEDNMAGWWFDQAKSANIPLLAGVINHYQPKVALAFNQGQRLPLVNNNPGYEDFTFGYPFWDLVNYPASHCRNFIVIPMQEATSDGYYYGNGDDESPMLASLGHLFMPLLSNWDGGRYVWDPEQASEWQSRFMTAGGGWTWNVRRGTALDRSVIHKGDLDFLMSIYDGMKSARPPWKFECDWSPSASPSIEFDVGR